jgi:putative tricarboxylic transport membrane protein
LSARAARAGEFVLALGLAALGAFILFETHTIAETTSYSGVGPRLFPYLIGFGLAACGVVLAWQALTGGWRNLPVDDDHAMPDWIALAIISAGIVLQMAIIGIAGFIIASAILFVLIARGYGSRRLLRDTLIALVLSTAVYLLFTKALGLNLPAGLIVF